MTTFDFSPLYRSSIGFDRLASLIDAATRGDHGQATYPPYNIERTDEDHYRISMAVAGFTQEDLSIESKSNQLTITGTKHNGAENKEYLHRGIAERSFEHRFQLADFVRVEGRGSRKWLTSCQPFAGTAGSHEAQDHHDSNYSLRAFDRRRKETSGLIADPAPL